MSVYSIILSYPFLITLKRLKVSPGIIIQRSEIKVSRTETDWAI